MGEARAQSHPTELLATDGDPALLADALADGERQSGAVVVRGTDSRPRRATYNSWTLSRERLRR